MGASTSKSRVEGVSPSDRTLVIVLSQVVTIVAMVVLWSIVRSRRRGAPEAHTQE